MIHKILVLGAFLSSAGCYYSSCPTVPAYPSAGEPAYVHVTVAPPPLKEEATMPAKPTPGSIWVAGHWDWQGEWTWSHGHWEEPRPGYVWTQPVATAHPGGGYRYHPGFWRPQSAPEPNVYSQPGVINVSVRATAGGSATATPTTQVTVAQPTASATAHAAPTYAQPTATATVRATPAQPAVTATVRATPTYAEPAEPAHPARPTHPVHPTHPAHPTHPTPAVQAQPARPATPTGHAQPAVAASPARPATPSARAAATISASPAHAATPATPASRAQPAVAATPAQPATGAGRAQPAVAATPARPATPSAHAQATVSASTALAATPTARGSATPHGRGQTNAPRAQLECQLNTSRAPAGGLVTLTGNDFGDAPLVRIGGEVASIVNRNRNQLRVQVPRQSGGGAVVVSTGGQESRCGSVTILR